MYPNIDTIACFVAAAKTLNFRAAAKSVALTPAAFGKRIAQLEDQVGNRLFDRTTRHVALTQAGQNMLPVALRLLSTAEECLQSGRGLSGPAPFKLTIGTRHELGISWILPMLPKLSERFPHVAIDLYFGSGPDLEERVKAFDVHCAVTSRVFIDPVFDVLRLVKEDYVFVAAPSLLAQRPLRSLTDAHAHTLFDVQPEKPLFKYFRDAPGAPDPIRFNEFRMLGTTAAIRYSVLSGQGVAVLPAYLVADDLAQGNLAQVFPEVTANFDHFRLMYRHDDPRAAFYGELAATMRTIPLT